MSIDDKIKQIRETMDPNEVAEGMFNSTKCEGDFPDLEIISKHIMLVFPELSAENIKKIMDEETYKYIETELERKLLNNTISEEDIYKYPQQALELLKNHWSNDLRFMSVASPKKVMLGVKQKFMYDRTDINIAVTVAQTLMKEIQDLYKSYNIKKLMELAYNNRNKPGFYILFMAIINGYAEFQSIKNTQEFKNIPKVEGYDSLEDIIDDSIKSKKDTVH